MKEHEVRVEVNETELVPVKRVLFLIHPRFFDFRFAHSSAEVREKYLQLLDSYYEKAASYDDGLVLVVSPDTRPGLKDNLSYSMKRFLENLRMHVPERRCIVLTDNTSLGDLYSKFEAIAQARGYAIPKDVYSEALGEYMKYCVTAYASALNSYGNLERRTEIDPHAGDASLGIVEEHEDPEYRISTPEDVIAKVGRYPRLVLKDEDSK